MNQDFFSIFSWWIVFFSLGLIFLPSTTLIFKTFWDKGYIFSKILGMLLLTFIIWFLSSLGILPFNIISLLIILGVALVFNSYLAYKNKTSEIIKSKIKLLLFEEALFTGGLFFWAIIRSYEPSIHGLEKFMDYGFINSILRTEYFPPKDLWMSPLSINYYYFGHLVTAVLTKISGLNPAVTYNLMVAVLFAFTLSASFSIGSNLYHFFILHSQPRTINYQLKTILAGLLSGFLAALGGNLHTIYIFFQTYSPEKAVPFWQLPLEWNSSGYWYPNATRFIPFTIHEFPIYSFVVSDLHGHVLNIPFILLLLALTIKVFQQTKIERLDFVLFGLLIAVSVMTNVLDGPIYLLFLLIAFFASKISHESLRQSVSFAVKSLAPILLLAIIFSLPFWLSFKPFSSGIGVLCPPQFLISKGHLGPFLFEADHCARSPLWMLTILWGFFYAVALMFIFYILNIKKFTENWKLKIGNSADYLALYFIIIATILIIIPELFYVKDIYPAHYRANTVFKFGYQAFMILSLASGYMMVRMFTLKKWLLKIIILPLFFLVAIYPYFAINSYYGITTSGPSKVRSLDGLTYLNNLYPGDYQAILWINKNIPGQPVILEAQGDSYTDYARVSSNTGLPTVIGWPVHEWLWRGSYDEAGRRGTDVATLYESQDIGITESLLKKYNVSYIYIGSLERQKYPSLNENKFYNLGKIVFQSGDTRIYQLYK